MDNLPLSVDLVTYYKARISEFEKEREDLLARVDELEGSIQERHDIRRQLQQKENECRATQEALSTAMIQLHEEKQRVILLCAENDELKAQEMSDRRRIQQLLVLAKPREDEVTYFQSSIPCQIRAVKADDKGNKKSSNSKKAESGGTMKVFFPDENSESLLFRLESLQLHLEEQRRVWTEKEETLLEDRRILSAQAQKAQKEADARVQSLTDQLNRTEMSLHQAMKDYLYLRHMSQVVQRQMKEENEQLKDQNQQLLQRLDATHAKLAQDVSDTAALVERRQEALVEQQKKRADNAENAIYNLKREWQDLKSNYEEEIVHLKGKVKTFKYRWQTAEAARGQEMEGLEKDIATVQQSIRSLSMLLQKVIRDNIKEKAEGVLPHQKEKLRQAQVKKHAAAQVLTRPRSALSQREKENIREREAHEFEAAAHSLATIQSLQEKLSQISSAAHKLAEIQKQRLQPPSEAEIESEIQQLRGKTAEMGSRRSSDSLTGLNA